MMIQTDGLRNIITQRTCDPLHHSNVESVFTNMSDVEIISKYLKSKDELAFNEIVKRYENMVYGLAYRILKNHNLAEEVFQEVFLILSFKLDTFRDESKFSTWLYRITLNMCYVYRKNEYKHYSNLSIDSTLDNESSSDFKELLQDTRSQDPGQESSQSEILNVIEREIAKLPKKYRTVSILRDIEGLTNPEVARLLNISVPAVKSRIFRARNILKKRLKDKIKIESE